MVIVWILLGLILAVLVFGIEGLMELTYLIGGIAAAVLLVGLACAVVLFVAHGGS